MRNVLVVLSLLGLCVFATGAQAITITNVTTGQVLFYDNFEGVSPVSTAQAVDMTAEYDPVPVIGSYQMIDLGDEGEVGANVQVTNYDNGTPAGPGAYEGDNYLRTVLYLGHETQADLSVTPSSGDHINIAFMMYVPYDPGTYGIIKVRGANLEEGYQRCGARTNLDGSVGALDGGATGLTYQFDTWQKWELDYVIDSNTYTISVDDVVSNTLYNDTFSPDYGSPGNIVGMGFWNGGNYMSAFYIDAVGAVPEPGTIVFLLSGLAALALVWRRK